MSDNFAYLRWSILRWLPLAAIITLPIIAITWVYAAQMPKTYRAETLTLLELSAHAAPANPSLRQNAEAARAQVIQERILSRSSLQALTADPRLKSVEQTLTWKDLRSQITVERQTGRDKATFLNVIAVATDPAQASLIAQVVTSKMIQDTVQSERLTSEKAVRDAGDRAEAALAELRMQDETVDQFTAENARLLPPELGRLMIDRDTLEDDIRALETPKPSSLDLSVNPEVSRLRVELATAQAPPPPPRPCRQPSPRAIPPRATWCGGTCRADCPDTIFGICIACGVAETARRYTRNDRTRAGDRTQSANSATRPAIGGGSIPDRRGSVSGNQGSASGTPDCTRPDRAGWIRPTDFRQETSSHQNFRIFRGHRHSSFDGLFAEPDRPRHSPVTCVE